MRRPTTSPASAAMIISLRGGQRHAAGRCWQRPVLGWHGFDYIDGGTGFDTPLRLRGLGRGGEARWRAGAARRRAIPTSHLRAYGSAFGDVLIGDAGGNVLAGLDGADLLYGLGGNDILLGGGGADAFAFNTAGFGTDTVQDFATTAAAGATTTMSTSVASAPSAASPSRRSVPIRISSPTTAPSSSKASPASTLVAGDFLF